MSINRIQKLLFSEYCDFEDMVLIESPFAQTTREGEGIRQVHLGLTPTKLVLATDILPSAKESSVIYIPGIDPDIETFELVAVYPVECVNLSIFHRRKRQSLKAHFCNNRILYFELGGFEMRNMFWNLWCERVKFLCPEEPGSSHSETSVATSTTNSTLYLIASRHVINDKGIPQIWCHFGAGDNTAADYTRKWTDRNLFLGKSINESPLSYAPAYMSPTVAEFVQQYKLKNSRFPTPMTNPPNITRKISFGKIYQVNRFGKGVQEGCNLQLYLPAEDCLVPRRYSQLSVKSLDEFTLLTAVKSKDSLDYIDLCESAVRLWELNPKRYSLCEIRGRHRRRYGCSPYTYFLHGIGPWNITPGERFSVQVKRAVSVVSIRRGPVEPELRLPVSKRQLVASISCEALHLDSRLHMNSNSIKTAPKQPVLFFWTPEYWYRPRSAKDAYSELQDHLKKIRRYHQEQVTAQVTRKKKKVFKKRKNRKLDVEKYIISDTDALSEEFMSNKIRRTRKKSNTFFNVFALKKRNCNCDSDAEHKKETEETSIQFLRRILRMDIALTAWDFDSTTLAHQLTLIDRELFLKIPTIELGIIVWQQSSKNAPNVAALIAFSHRISCLVATEVLRDDSEKLRARLVARFINTADKCNQISNFQSCRSVLSGLQSPPIYRLHATWTYVRKRHASKYQLFEKLCRLYRDPRLPAYQTAFHRTTYNSSYLPYIGDLIARLLDRVPNFDENVLCRNSVKLNVTNISPNMNKMPEPKASTTLQKILSTFKLWQPNESSNQLQKTYHKNSPKKYNKIKQQKPLHNYFNSLRCYQDNRVQRLNEAIELLELSQRAAANYIIGNNELAREYLLKARYREDKENFFKSFNVEKPSPLHSPLHSYVKNKKFYD